MKSRSLLAFLALLPAAYAADPTPAPATSPAPTASAAASPAAAAPGMQDTPLPAIKASIQIPQGWFVKEESQDGVFNYQISREKAVNETDSFTAGFSLNVTTKVPDRAEMKPSAYAVEMMANGQDDTDLKKTTDGPWQIFRSGYKIEADAGDLQIVTFAKANDQSGTLYFITWQSPAAEEDQLAPVREAVLSSLKLDPSF